MTVLKIRLSFLAAMLLALGACSPDTTDDAVPADTGKLRLPTPTGPHKIGVVDFELVDENREESYAPGTPRRIPVRAWFPASEVSGEPRLYATPKELEHQITPLLQLTGRPEAIGAYEDVRTNAYESATPISDGPLPTLVFSHGGFAYLQTNTAQMEHLASHGYLVLSITHPYVSATTFHENGDITETDTSLIEGMMAAISDSDYMDAFTSDDVGRRLEVSIKNYQTHVLVPHFLVWQEDFMHVIDRLEAGDLPDAAQPLLPLVDMDRIGLFGMSFGASGSAAAHKDERVKAAVNIDGGVFDVSFVDTEVRMPVLVFHNDRNLGFPGVTLFPHSEFVYESLATIGTRDDVIRLETIGSTHSGYTDAVLMPQSVRDASELPDAGLGTIDGRRMVNIMNDFIKAFFDQHLSGQGNGIDAALRERYPEVVDVDLSGVRDWAASEPQPGFMSYTHVFRMNRILAADVDSKAACAELDRRYVMAYELENGPEGETVWWQMSFDPAEGIRFSLEAPTTPADLTFQGDWAAMIRATRDIGEGKEVEIPLTPVGDVSVSEKTAAAFAAGQKAAGMKTVFPDV